MNKFFDKIYVISLVSNKERQEFIKYQMNELGLEFEFIYGIDFDNLSFDKNQNNIEYPDLCKEQFNLNNNRMYSCTIAHYQAVLQAYEFGYNNILIIEDDICFIKDKNLIEYYLNNIPKDADFITYAPRFIDLDEIKSFINIIENNKNNKYIEIPNDYYTLNGGMMIGIMNRKTMELYLNSQRSMFNTSDWVNGIFRNSQIKRYTIYECICLDQYHIVKYNNDINLIKNCNNYDFCYEICNFIKNPTNFYQSNFEELSNINFKLQEDIFENQRSIKNFKFNE